MDILPARRRQRGFIINPFSFGGGGGTDPSFSNVMLLCHADGTNGSTSFTNVVQALGRGSTLAATGSTTVSTSSPLFGTGSADIAGGGITSAASADYVVGTGNYTIEMAIYTGSPSQTSILMDLRTGSGGQGFALYIQSGKFQVYAASGFNNTLITNAGTVSTNTWQRVALTRNVAGATLKLAIDGTVIQTGNDSTLTYSTSGGRIGIGIAYNNTAQFTGKFDEIRFTKGVARYSGNYTVDAAAFPDS